MSIEEKARTYARMADYYADAAERCQNRADERWDQLLEVSKAFEEVSRLASQQVPDFYERWVAHYWKRDPPLMPKEVLDEALGIREN